MDIPVSVWHTVILLSLVLHSFVDAYENLALEKPVKLSSRAGLGTPGRFAVNGKRSGLMKDGCASTKSEPNPWIRVDLGDDYLVSYVFIVNWKYPEKIAKYSNNSFNFPPWNPDLKDLYVGIIHSDVETKKVWFHNGTVGYKANISSDDPACGRYVTVRLNVTDSLTICDLEVYGQNDGNWTDWGEWSPCTKPCGNGTTSRSRSCNSEPCCGSAKQTVSCNTQECPVCGCSNIEPRDCQDVKDSGLTDSGVYHVTPLGSYEGVDVYCDMETDKGGWLVIQRRVDDSVDFDRNWLNYASGFGEPSKESNFWLGLRHLYQILCQGHYELLVVMTGAKQSMYYAKYHVFKLGGTSSKYQLTVDEYTGNTIDILTRYKGHSFSTSTKQNCTALHQGGWWSNDCAYLNLNGMYTNQGDEEGVKMGSAVVLAAIEMKIRRG